MNDIPEKHEQKVQIEEGGIVIVNLGTDEDKKEIKIGTELNDVERQELLELLKEYVDVFAWSYSDLAYIIMHEIQTKPECKYVKQK